MRPLGLILAPEVSNRECFGFFFNLIHKQELHISEEYTCVFITMIHSKYIFIDGCE